MISDELSAQRPPRSEVRADAERAWAKIRNGVAAGQNGHQMTLDLFDTLENYAVTLQPELGQRYSDMFSEEISALRAKQDSDDAAVNPRESRHPSTSQCQSTKQMILIALVAIILSNVNRFFRSNPISW